MHDTCKLSEVQLVTPLPPFSTIDLEIRIAQDLSHKITLLLLTSNPHVPPPKDQLVSGGIPQLL